MTRETSEALAVAAAYLYVRRIEDYPHTAGAGEILDLGSGLYVHGHDTIADLAARIAEALPGAEDALREQHLVAIELEVVFATLLDRLPGLRPAVPLDQVSFKHDAGLYGVWDLPVTW
ncbi:hypothetical protein [Kitasatospora sp. NPDC057541]|uniref:hypothetical protein n=1 Tax=unclassified Kitasatospora TaxID=2633591 RepID=UPI00369C86E8